LSGAFEALRRARQAQQPDVAERARAALAELHSQA
jgi:hypothetical protein